MPRRLAIVLASAFILGAAPGFSGESSRYISSWQDFSCMVPENWRVFEEAEPTGYAVHLIGPDDPAGGFRTGIDIHWFDSTRPGFLPVSKAVDAMRSSDDLVEREATPLRVMRGAGTIARIFEVTENRFLPLGNLPASQEHVHSYVAVLPRGQSYWVVSLSSPRSVYLDYHDLFIDFLRSFHPMGY